MTFAGADAAILLPVAYHSHPDNGVIRIVGFPQTVIPVAVSHKVHEGQTLCRPLLISSSLVAGVEIPEAKIRVGRIGAFQQPPQQLQQQKFYLPLALSPQPSTSTLSVANCYPPPTTAAQAEKLCISTEPKPDAIEEPLDLSLRSLRRSTPAEQGSDQPYRAFLRSAKQAVAAQKADHLSVQKRFSCDCGVSFMTEETLKGHQDYYCRNRANSIISNRWVRGCACVRLTKIGWNRWSPAGTTSKCAGPVAANEPGNKRREVEVEKERKC